MTKISERLWKIAGQKGIPIIGAFELLPLCNLHCKMCYVRKEKSYVLQQGGLQNGEFWLRTAGQALEEGMLYPLLTGGEPLLHPEFADIYTGICQMGMQPSINSNGTLMGEEMAEVFQRNLPRMINITLYGASEASYQNLCGDGGAFERVRKGVELLKARKIPFRFNASITPENQMDLPAMIEYGKTLDVPVRVATYMFPPLRRDARMVGKNDRLSPRQAAYARVLSDYLQLPPEEFLKMANRYGRYVPPRPLTGKEEERKPLCMTCRAGNSSVWIDWQGNVSVCGMFADSVGNLLEKPFSEIWQQTKSHALQLRFGQGCADCPNQPLCHPCMAMLNNECTNLQDRPRYVCEMTAETANYYRIFEKKYYSHVDKNLSSSSQETMEDNGMVICETDEV